MGVECMVKGCCSKGFIEGLCYFYVNDVRLKKWIEIVNKEKPGMKCNPFKKGNLICGRHFNRKDLFKVGSKSVLKKTAIPTNLFIATEQPPVVAAENKTPVTKMLKESNSKRIRPNEAITENVIDYIDLDCEEFSSSNEMNDPLQITVEDIRNANKDQNNKVDDPITEKYKTILETKRKIAPNKHKTRIKSVKFLIVPQSKIKNGTIDLKSAEAIEIETPDCSNLDLTSNVNVSSPIPLQNHGVVNTSSTTEKFRPVPPLRVFSGKRLNVKTTTPQDTKKVECEPSEVFTSESEVFNLDTLKFGLKNKSIFLPERWCWVETSKQVDSLMFLHVDEVSLQVRLHLYIHKDLTATLCTTDLVVHTDVESHLESMSDFELLLKNTNNLKVCLGPEFEPNKRPSTCQAFIEDTQSFLYSKDFPRCVECQKFRCMMPDISLNYNNSKLMERFKQLQNDLRTLKRKCNLMEKTVKTT